MAGISPCHIISLRSTPKFPPFKSLALLCTEGLQHRVRFSTAAALCTRHKAYKKRRDGNPDRGVSVLRRTGLRFSNGMSLEPLPQPVLDPKRRSKVQVDPDHGLWGFFNRDKKALSTPEEDHAHGRLIPVVLSRKCLG